MKSSFCHCSLDSNPHPKCQGPPLKSCAEKSHFEILDLERRVYSFHLVWFPPENGHLLFVSGMVGGSSKNHFLLVLNSVPLTVSRWWFQRFLFSSLFGEDFFQFDDDIFQLGGKKATKTR